VKTSLNPVQLLWVISFATQAVVCAALFLRQHYRVLPLFTLYVVLNLCQAVLLYLVYLRYGFGSLAAYVFGWWSEAITLVAQVFATLEVLRLALNPYRGIWGMTWRVLTAVSAVVLLGILLAARGDANWALMEANRGYHVIFAATILTYLVLIRHYSIRVAPAYKDLVIGFCFYSCIAISLNTVLQGVLFSRFKNYQSIWDSVGLLSYIVVQVIWIGALSRPLPATDAVVKLLPASDYRRMKPAINYQLQAMNERLSNFWNLEEPGN
jgi:hypothetical protein